VTTETPPLPAQTANGMWPCGQCERQFNSLLGLRTHESRMHVGAEKREKWNQAIREGHRDRAGTAGRRQPKDAALIAQVDAIYNAMTTREKDAYRKRKMSWQKKKKPGFTMARFYQQEIDRARELASVPEGPAGVTGGGAVVRIDATAPPTRAELNAADRVFEKVATLTDMCFPKGVPSSRIIEVAQWQIDTLKMLQAP
jgi:hypothetical protein